MAVALSLLGFFLFLDAAYTPLAVVFCVISYNAAFGASWGPVAWLFSAGEPRRSLTTLSLSPHLLLLASVAGGEGSQGGHH